MPQVASHPTFPSSRGGPERARSCPEVAQPGSGGRVRQNRRTADIKSSPTVCHLHVGEGWRVLSPSFSCFCKPRGKALGTNPCCVRWERTQVLHYSPALLCVLGRIISGLGLSFSIYKTKLLALRVLPSQHCGLHDKDHPWGREGPSELEPQIAYVSRLGTEGRQP